MTILYIIAAVVFQGAAIWTGSGALHEHEQWNPNWNRRNRWAFACLVLSVATMLTAYRTGVNMAGC